MPQFTIPRIEDHEGTISYFIKLLAELQTGQGMQPHDQAWHLWPVYALATPTTLALGSVAAEGSAETLVRGDHVHGMPTLRQEVKDGLTTTWTLSYTPVPQVVILFADQGILRPTVDYTLSGAIITIVGDGLPAKTQGLCVYFSA